MAGGEGEYDVQEGFGWTNGVLLSLFSRYGDKISSSDTVSSAGSLRATWLVIVAMVSLSVGVIACQRRRF